MPTFFEIVKETLDLEYGEIADKDKDDKISKCLDTLSGRFKDVLNKGGPSYKDSLTRFAYVFKYTTAHADYLNSIIGWSPELRKILKQEKVNIACIGGGPGSDVLGFLKYLLTQKDKPQLAYVILDKELAWNNTWANLDATVSAELKTSRTYLPLDVTDSNSYDDADRAYKSDIFTMLYFLSEVFRHKDDVTEFLKHCFGKMKKGAMFIVLDFHDSRLEEWIDECAADSGLEVTTEIETRMTMDPSEEKDDLGEFTKKFGSPKLQAQVFVRVFRKT